MNSLMIPSLCYFGITLAFSSKTNLRYLLPVFAPFTIVSVYVITDRLVSLIGLKKALIFFHLVSLVALWPSAKAVALWSTKKMTLSYLAGLATRESYLTKSPGFISAASYINQRVSVESRVLMLFEARGFYFEVPVIQDNLFSNWILLAAKSSSLNCLEGSGISHVLFSGSALDYFLKRGLDSKVLHLEEFQKFAQECLHKVYQSNKHILYRVEK